MNATVEAGRKQHSKMQGQFVVKLYLKDCLRIPFSDMEDSSFG